MTALQREYETSVWPLKKADIQWIQLFESRQSRTKAIFEDSKKIPQKLEYILFLRYFFTFTVQKWRWRLGLQVIKIQNYLQRLFIPWSININVHVY